MSKTAFSDVVIYLNESDGELPQHAWKNQHKRDLFHLQRDFTLLSE